MTAQTDPYVRVYYRIIDDPKFAGVYDNDAALAAWLRLLLAADAMYPAPATLPHGIRRAALAKLTDAGLIDLLPGSRFRLHGLHNERERRTDQARRAARKRWDEDDPGRPSGKPTESKGNALAMRQHSNGNAEAMHSEPSQAEPIRTEPSQAEPAMLAMHELPSESDSATLACRQLFDSGKWLGDREYVAAWEDMDRRYTPEWVQTEIAPAFGACLEKRGKVLPWDLKRMTEQRLAERARSEQREREEAERRRFEGQATRQTIEPMTEEEREKQGLFKRAIDIWRQRGMRGRVPEDVDELRAWLAANEQQGAPA